MAFLRAHAAAYVVVAGLSMITASCGGGIFRPEYEYEEEIYLALDGSATLNVNASVAALVALRGADFDPDPRARLDRGKIRALFAVPGGDVRVSVSRRDGRRFVHVSVDVADVRRLPTLAPFAWSTYRFDRRGEVFEYRQVVGPSAAREVGDVGWSGAELVNFKMHAPSEIVFHNSATGVERGNILAWQQPLAERLRGTPLDIQVQLETETILYSTLLLFGGSAAAAALTFALVIWWVARRGRSLELPAPSSQLPNSPGGS
jgi:hypothetical protein